MQSKRRVLCLCAFLACFQAYTMAAALDSGRGDMGEENIISGSGCGKADIFFVLDQSNSIWPENMVKAKKFIASVVEELPISPDAFQVGLISFAERATNRIKLNDYSQKGPLKDAIIKLRRIHGSSTATHDGLKMLRQMVSKAEDGARQGVAKIAVLITDGSSSEPHKMAREAALVHQANITMFAIGLPDRYQRANMTELNIIASDPDEQYRFMVDDYNALSSIELTISRSICGAVSLPPMQKPTPKPTTPKPTTTTPQPTTTTTQPPPTTPKATTKPSTPKPTTQKPSTEAPTSKPTTEKPTKKPELPPKEQPKGCKRTDIIFIPSETADPLELNSIGSFISATTKTLKPDNGKFRISILSKACHPWNGFDGYRETKQIIDKVDSWHYTLPDTAKQLLRMRYKFNATDSADDQDGRVAGGIRRAAILFLDQKSINMEETIKQARHAQEKGVEIFVFAIGKHYSQAEAEMIASLHSTQHLRTVESYSSLSSEVQRLSELLAECPQVC